MKRLLLASILAIALCINLYVGFRLYQNVQEAEREVMEAERRYRETLEEIAQMYAESSLTLEQIDQELDYIYYKLLRQGYDVEYADIEWMKQRVRELRESS